MIKKKRLYTYYTIRIRFDNTQEQELSKKFYHTKNKSAFVKECIKKELTLTDQS